MKDKIIENVQLTFTPDFKITEGKEGSRWLKIGGTALVEGVSKNKNKYTFENLSENSGREFKWLVGHPMESVEDHVIGKGQLSLNGKELLHEGKIMNTARHPDVIEKVQNGLLGPSIHASAKKITEGKEGDYLIEGLSIDGIGLVAFQGVKQASIDYAIAESFKDLNDVKESSEGDDINNDKGDNMSEEEVKQEAPVEAEAEKAPETPAEESKEEAVEEPQESEKVKALEAEIAKLKESKKIELVKQIVECNKDMKEEDLMKESEEKLNVVLEYEKKLSSSEPKSVGIVESEEPVAQNEICEEQKDGSISLTEAAWKKFNDEIKERI